MCKKFLLISLIFFVSPILTSAADPDGERAALDALRENDRLYKEAVVHRGERCVGAGITFFSVNEDNQVVLLVTRERGGSHPGSYADAGGKRDIDRGFLNWLRGVKETLERTAAREASEEMMETFRTATELETILREKRVFKLIAGNYADFFVPVKYSRDAYADKIVPRNSEKDAGAWVTLNGVATRLENTAAIVSSHPRGFEPENLAIEDKLMRPVFLRTLRMAKDAGIFDGLQNPDYLRMAKLIP